MKQRNEPEGGDKTPEEIAKLTVQAKEWFAEAREQTKRDDQEVAAWHRRRGRSSDGDGGTGSWGGDGGDCGGGD